MDRNRKEKGVNRILPMEKDGEMLDKLKLAASIIVFSSMMAFMVVITIINNILYIIAIILIIIFIVLSSIDYMNCSSMWINCECMTFMICVMLVFENNINSFLKVIFNILLQWQT